MTWQEEFENKLNNGEITTTSQVENFIEERLDKCSCLSEMNTFASEIWTTYYQWRAKGTKCEGCKHAGYWGIYPCNECSRKIQLFDHYEKEESLCEE